MKIKNRIGILIMVMVIVITSVTCVSAGSSKIPHKAIVEKHMRTCKHDHKRGHKRLDYIKVVNKNKDNSWVVYYVECDGDCYVVTVHHKKVDVCEILN